MNRFVFGEKGLYFLCFISNHFSMKKVIIIVVIIIAAIVVWVTGVYNSLVSARAGVDREWSNVEVQYQRRADLVPQLVATVSGVANFEKSTLTQVVEARAKATSTVVNTADEQSLKQFDASQMELSGALSRLLVTMEAYPQLTASKSFQDLQAQLEGTENRIAVARGDYNTVATTWNASVLQVPTVFVARIFGFEKAALFDATTGSETAPKVEFTVQ